MGLISLKTVPVFQHHVRSGQNLEGQQGDHSDGRDPHRGTLCLERTSEQHSFCASRLVSFDTDNNLTCSIQDLRKTILGLRLLSM